MLQNRQVGFVSSGTAWYDYVPVKVAGTVKDSSDAAGYIEATNVTGVGGRTAAVGRELFGSKFDWLDIAATLAGAAFVWLV